MSRKRANKQDSAKVDPWSSKDALEQMEARARNDGFRNELTGIGDWLKDKMFGGKFNGPDFIVNLRSNTECEQRWRGSDLGGRIVETLPDEMTREGWEMSVQPSEDDADKTDAFPPQMGMMPPAPSNPKPLPENDDESTQLIEDLDGMLEELGATDAFWKALCYERAYGGGAILVGADDGMEDLSQPLDEERISDIRFLNAFSGGYDGEIVAWSYYRDPAEPKYGMPMMYMLRNQGVPITQVPAPDMRTAVLAPPPLPVVGSGTEYGTLIRWVHESRLLIFPGTAVSNRIRGQLRGWGDSIFTRVDEVLSDYDQTWGAVANLMSDFSQFIIKIKGLAQAMGGNNKAGTATLTNRARALSLGKSIGKVLLVDAEEDAMRDTASLSGISDILQQFSLRLAAAADMPVALLMGQAPAGLNATGASDIRFFYDRVAAKQRRRMMPQLKRLLKLCMLAKEGPFAGKEPAKWNVKFNSLYQLTETEQAMLRKTVADADVAYINAGVLTPEEVAASAFGGSEWTMERTIDLEGRQAMAEQDAADREARAKAMEEAMKNPPSPPQPNDKPDQNKEDPTNV